MDLIRLFHTTMSGAMDGYTKNGIIVMMISLFLLVGCQTTIISSDRRSDFVEGRELLCPVEDKEEAMKIAQDYDIELIEVSQGLAVFHTDKDPYSIIEYGKKNNLVELSLNTKSILIKESK